MWGVALLSSDLLHWLMVNRVDVLIPVGLHWLLMCLSLLLFLPDTTARATVIRRCPCCFDLPLVPPLLAFYLGLFTLPRASWNTDDATFFGPLEEWPPMHFLWPVFTTLQLLLSGLLLLWISLNGLFTLLSS